MRYLYLLIVLVFLGCGSSNPALSVLQQFTDKAQPVWNATYNVCEIAHNQLKQSGESTIEIDKYCSDIEQGWEAIRLAHEAAIIALGGKPCYNDCEE